MTIARKFFIFQALAICCHGVEDASVTMRKILNDFARAIVFVTISRISNDLDGLRLFIKLGSLASLVDAIPGP